MRDIDKRVYEEAKEILEKKSTIREVAKRFKVSKSTVHNDLTKRLKIINLQLYIEVKQVLLYNISMRHIRGGESTKKKYLQKRKQSK